jgi:16S rRNA (guanine527-N7)-methyltransferase
MFHVKHEGWDEAADLAGVALSSLMRERLDAFETSLVERAAPMGMIAAPDVPRVRERHILDSIRGAPYLPGAGTVCDLGSGAGLPGLVLSIVRPDLRWVLIEVRRNRAGFIEEMVSMLGLSGVTVHARRAETFRTEVDACTARAFAPAPMSWAAADRILEPGAPLIYWAGSTFEPSRDVPESVKAAVFATPGLARSGPLVIMTR